MHSVGYFQTKQHVSGCVYPFPPGQRKQFNVPLGNSYILQPTRRFSSTDRNGQTYYTFPEDIEVPTMRDCWGKNAFK